MDVTQGDHKPGVLFLTNKIVSVWSNSCVTWPGLGLQMNKVSWISQMVTVCWWPVILLELICNDPWHMQVIITFTFCCDNLWKSIVYGSGKSEKSLENSGNVFSLTLWSPCYSHWRIYWINHDAVVCVFVKSATEPQGCPWQGAWIPSTYH